MSTQNIKRDPSDFFEVSVSDSKKTFVFKMRNDQPIWQQINRKACLYSVYHSEYQALKDKSVIDISHIAYDSDSDTFLYQLVTSDGVEAREARNVKASEAFFKTSLKVSQISLPQISEKKPDLKPIPILSSLYRFLSTPFAALYRFFFVSKEIGTLVEASGPLDMLPAGEASHRAMLEQINFLQNLLAQEEDDPLVYETVGQQAPVTEYSITGRDAEGKPNLPSAARFADKLCQLQGHNYYYLKGIVDAKSETSPLANSLINGSKDFNALLKSLSRSNDSDFSNHLDKLFHNNDFVLLPLNVKQFVERGLINHFLCFERKEGRFLMNLIYFPEPMSPLFKAGGKEQLAACKIETYDLSETYARHCLIQLMGEVKNSYQVTDPYELDAYFTYFSEAAACASTEEEEAFFNDLASRGKNIQNLTPLANYSAWLLERKELLRKVEENKGLFENKLTMPLQAAESYRRYRDFLPLALQQAKSEQEKVLIEEVMRLGSKMEEEESKHPGQKQKLTQSLQAFAGFFHSQKIELESDPFEKTVKLLAGEIEMMNNLNLKPEENNFEAIVHQKACKYSCFLEKDTFYPPEEQQILGRAHKTAAVLKEAYEVGKQIQSVRSAKRAHEVDELVEEIDQKLDALEAGVPYLIPLGYGEGKSYSPHFLIFEKIRKLATVNQEVKTVESLQLKHVRLSSASASNKVFDAVTTYQLKSERKNLLRALITLHPFLTKEEKAQSDSTPPLPDATFELTIREYADKIASHLPVKPNANPMKGLYALVKEIGWESDHPLAKCDDDAFNRIAGSKIRFYQYYLSRFIQFFNENEADLTAAQQIKALEAIQLYADKFKKALAKEVGAAVAIQATDELLFAVEQRFNGQKHILEAERLQKERLNQRIIPFQSAIKDPVSTVLQGVEAEIKESEEFRVRSKDTKRVLELKTQLQNTGLDKPERSKALKLLTDLLAAAEEYLQARDTRPARILFTSILEALPQPTGEKLPNSSGTSKVFWDTLEPEELFDWSTQLSHLSERIFEAVLLTGEFPLQPREVIEYNIVLPLILRRLFQLRLPHYEKRFDSLFEKGMNNPQVVEEICRKYPYFQGLVKDQIAQQTIQSLEADWKREDKAIEAKIKQYNKEMKEYEDYKKKYPKLLEAYDVRKNNWNATQLRVQQGSREALPPEPSCPKEPEEPKRPEILTSEDKEQLKLKRNLQKKTLIEENEGINTLLNKLDELFENKDGAVSLKKQELKQFWMKFISTPSKNLIFSDDPSLSAILGSIFRAFLKIEGTSPQELKELYGYFYFLCSNGLPTFMEREKDHDIWFMIGDFSLAAGSDPRLEQRIHSCKRMLGSLHSDKPKIWNPNHLGNFLIGFDRIGDGKDLVYSFNPKNWPKNYKNVAFLQSVFQTCQGYFSIEDKEDKVKPIVPGEVMFLVKLDQMRAALEKPQERIAPYTRAAHKKAFNLVKAAVNQGLQTNFNFPFGQVKPVEISFFKKSIVSMPRIYVVPDAAGRFVLAQKPGQTSGTYQILQKPLQASTMDHRGSYVGDINSKQGSNSLGSHEREALENIEGNYEDHIGPYKEFILKGAASERAKKDAEDHAWSAGSIVESFHYICQYPDDIEKFPSIRDTLYLRFFQGSLIQELLRDNPEVFKLLTPNLKKIMDEQWRKKHFAGLAFLYLICDKIHQHIDSLIEESELKSLAELKENNLGPHSELITQLTRVKQVFPGVAKKEVKELFDDHSRTPDHKLFATYLLYYFKDHPPQMDEASLFDICSVITAFHYLEKSPSPLGHSGMQAEITQWMHSTFLRDLMIHCQQDPHFAKTLLNHFSPRKSLAWKCAEDRDYVYIHEYEENGKKIPFFIDLRTGNTTEGPFISIPFGGRCFLPEGVLSNEHHQFLFGKKNDFNPIVSFKEEGDVIQYWWVDKEGITFRWKCDSKTKELVNIIQEYRGTHYLFQRAAIDNSYFQIYLNLIFNQKNPRIESMIENQGIWIRLDQKGAPSQEEAYLVIGRSDDCKLESKSHRRHYLNRDLFRLHLRGREILGATLAKGKEKKWVCAGLLNSQASLFQFRNMKDILLLSKDKKQIDEIHFPEDPITKQQLVLLREGDDWVKEGNKDWKWQLTGTGQLEKQFGKEFREYVLPMVHSKTGEKEFWIYPYPVFTGKNDKKNISLIKNFFDTYRALGGKVKGFENLIHTLFKDLFKNIMPKGMHLEELLDDIGAMETGLFLQAFSSSMGSKRSPVTENAAQLENKLSGKQDSSILNAVQSINILEDSITPSPFRFAAQKNGESSSHFGFFYLSYLAATRGNWGIAVRYLEQMADIGDSKTHEKEAAGKIKDLDEIQQFRSHIFKLYFFEFLQGNLNILSPSPQEAAYRLKQIAMLMGINSRLSAQLKEDFLSRPLCYTLQLLGAYLFYPAYQKEMRTNPRLLRQENLLLTPQEEANFALPYMASKAFGFTSEGIGSLLAGGLQGEDWIKNLMDSLPENMRGFFDFKDSNPAADETRALRYTIPKPEDIESMVRTIAGLYDKKKNLPVSELHQRYNTRPKWQTVLSNFWTYWEWIYTHKDLKIEDLAFLFEEVLPGEKYHRQIDTARRLLLMLYFYHTTDDPELKKYRDDNRFHFENILAQVRQRGSLYYRNMADHEKKKNAYLIEAARNPSGWGLGKYALYKGYNVFQKCRLEAKHRRKIGMTHYDECGIGIDMVKTSHSLIDIVAKPFNPTGKTHLLTMNGYLPAEVKKQDAPESGEEEDQETKALPAKDRVEQQLKENYWNQHLGIHFQFLRNIMQLNEGMDLGGHRLTLENVNEFENRLKQIFFVAVDHPDLVDLIGKRPEAAHLGIWNDLYKEYLSTQAPIFGLPTHNIFSADQFVSLLRTHAKEAHRTLISEIGLDNTSYQFDNHSYQKEIKPSHSNISIPVPEQPPNWDDYFLKIKKIDAVWEKNTNKRQKYFEESHHKLREANENHALNEGMKLAAEEKKIKKSRSLRVETVQKELPKAIRERKDALSAEKQSLKQEILQFSYSYAEVLDFLPFFQAREIDDEKILEILIDRYKEGKINVFGTDPLAIECREKIETLITEFLLVSTEIHQLDKASRIVESMRQELKQIKEKLRSDIFLLEKEKIFEAFQQEVSMPKNPNSINWLLLSADLHYHLTEGADRLRFCDIKIWENEKKAVFEMPELARRCLVFDYQTQQITRVKAKEAVEQMLGAKTANGKPIRFVQLRMGIGKTSFVFPQITRILQSQRRLPVVMTTEELVKQLQQTMDKRAYLFDFDINYGLARVADAQGELKDPPHSAIMNHLKSLSETLQRLQQEGRYVLTTPARLAYLRNKRIECQYKLARRIRGEPRIEQEIFQELNLLKQIEGYFKQPEIVFLQDEDVNLDISFEYNFAIGDAEAVDAVRYDMAEKILRTMWEIPPRLLDNLIEDQDLMNAFKAIPNLYESLCDVQLKNAFKSNREIGFAHLMDQLNQHKQSLLSNPTAVQRLEDAHPYIWKSLKGIPHFRDLLATNNIRSVTNLKKELRILVAQICGDKDFWKQVGMPEKIWTAIDQEEFIDYALGMRKEPPAGLSAWENASYQKYVAAFKTYLASTFHSVYPVNPRLDRGIREKDGCFVVPYQDGCEKQNVQYGEESEAILHHFFHYISNPVSEKVFRKYLEEIKQYKPGIDLSPFQPGQDGKGWYSQMAEKAMHYQQKYGLGDDVYTYFAGAPDNEMDEKDRKELVEAFALDRLQFLRYIMQIKPKDIRIHRKQIVCNSQDVVLGGDVRVASGTGDVYSLNLTSMESDASSAPDQITGETLLCLDLDKEAIEFDDPMVLIQKMVKDKKCRAILNHDYDLKSEKIAAALRTTKDAIDKQFIFRDSKTLDKLVWNPGDQNELVAYDPALVDQNNAFFLYGPPDVRGVDFAIPKGNGIYGVALVGLGTDLDTLNQLLGRLRQLGNGQEAFLAFDKKMAARIREELKIPKGQPIRTGDAVNYIKIKSRKDKKINHIKAATFKIREVLKKKIDSTLAAPYAFDIAGTLGIDSLSQLFQDANKDIQRGRAPQWVENKLQDLFKGLKDNQYAQTYLPSNFLDEMGSLAEEAKKKAENNQNQNDNNQAPPVLQPRWLTQLEQVAAFFGKGNDILIQFEKAIFQSYQDLYIMTNEIDWQADYEPVHKQDSIDYIVKLHDREMERAAKMQWTCNALLHELIRKNKIGPGVMNFYVFQMKKKMEALNQAHKQVLEELDQQKRALSHYFDYLDVRKHQLECVQMNLMQDPYKEYRANEFLRDQSEEFEKQVGKLLDVRGISLAKAGPAPEAVIGFREEDAQFLSKEERELIQKCHSTYYRLLHTVIQPLLDDEKAMSCYEAVIAEDREAFEQASEKLDQESQDLFASFRPIHELHSEMIAFSLHTTSFVEEHIVSSKVGGVLNSCRGIQGPVQEMEQEAKKFIYSFLKGKSGIEILRFLRIKDPAERKTKLSHETNAIRSIVSGLQAYLEIHKEIADSIENPDQVLHIFRPRKKNETLAKTIQDWLDAKEEIKSCKKTPDPDQNVNETHFLAEEFQQNTRALEGSLDPEHIEDFFNFNGFYEKFFNDHMIGYLHGSKGTLIRDALPLLKTGNRVEFRNKLELKTDDLQIQILLSAWHEIYSYYREGIAFFRQSNFNNYVESKAKELDFLEDKIKNESKALRSEAEAALHEKLAALIDEIEAAKENFEVFSEEVQKEAGSLRQRVIRFIRSDLQPLINGPEGAEFLKGLDLQLLGKGSEDYELQIRKSIPRDICQILLHFHRMVHLHKEVVSRVVPVSYRPIRYLLNNLPKNIPGGVGDTTNNEQQVQQQVQTKQLTEELTEVKVQQKQKPIKSKESYPFILIPPVDYSEFKAVANGHPVHYSNFESIDTAFSIDAALDIFNGIKLPDQRFYISKRAKDLLQVKSGADGASADNGIRGEPAFYILTMENKKKEIYTVIVTRHEKEETISDGLRRERTSSTEIGAAIYALSKRNFKTRLVIDNGHTLPSADSSEMSYSMLVNKIILDWTDLRFDELECLTERIDRMNSSEFDRFIDFLKALGSKDMIELVKKIRLKDEATFRRIILDKFKSGYGISELTLYEKECLIATLKKFSIEVLSSEVGCHSKAIEELEQFKKDLEKFKKVTEELKKFKRD